MDPNVNIPFILAKEGVAETLRGSCSLLRVVLRLLKVEENSEIGKLLERLTAAHSFAKALMHFRTEQQKLPPKWEPKYQGTFRFG